MIVGLIQTSAFDHGPGFCSDWVSLDDHGQAISSVGTQLTNL